MTPGDTFDPARLAWIKARSHKAPPHFDDGWTRPNGPLGAWIAGMLTDGKLGQATDVAADIAKIPGDSPHAEALRAIVPFLRELVRSEGNKSTGSPVRRRGPRGARLTREQSGIVADARLTLWLAIYARLLLKAHAVTRADAECFLTYFYFWTEPGWKLGRRRAIDVVKPYAERVLREEKLITYADARNWRHSFREVVGDRLAAKAITRVYLRGIDVELDT